MNPMHTRLTAADIEAACNLFDAHLQPPVIAEVLEMPESMVRAALRHRPVRSLGGLGLKAMGEILFASSHS